MCGEKKPEAKSSVVAQGSPPHVRGKAFIFPVALYDCGITPACAGKSRWCTQRNWGFQDHPRMCGEKCSSTVTATAIEGSPPHVRGKVDNILDLLCIIGITPACAGKSPKALKIKHLNEQVLKFPLTSDRSHRSTDSPSVLDGSLIHPVRNTMPLP